MNNHKLIIGIVIAAFGASLGFNVSQILVVGDVKSHGTEITNLKAADVEIRQREAEDIKNLNTLFSETLALNRELVGLVKVQNELLKNRK